MSLAKPTGEATSDTPLTIADALEAAPPSSAGMAFRVPLPWQPKHQQRLALVIPNVLSLAECSSIIRLCERRGFEPALLNVGGGHQVLATEARKSGRCIVDDVWATELLFERVRHCCRQSAQSRTVARSGAPSG
jgi:hypothetical protein